MSAVAQQAAHGPAGIRARLLATYGGRCAITDADVPKTSEAGAHIVADADGGTMATSNVLLLRADMHTLFDLRLIAVETFSWKVVTHPDIRFRELGTQVYETPLRLPTTQTIGPRHWTSTASDLVSSACLPPCQTVVGVSG